MTVLVVEDDATLRSTITRILAALGHDVVAVASVRDAVATIEARVVDAVLSDYHLDGGPSGLDLGVWLIGHEKSRPVLVFCTADPDEPLLAFARLYGVTILPKPFAISDLESAMEETA